MMNIEWTTYARNTIAGPETLIGPAMLGDPEKAALEAWYWLTATVQDDRARRAEGQSPLSHPRLRNAGKIPVLCVVLANACGMSPSFWENAAIKYCEDARSVP